MADDQNSDQEKTEEPTQKRLDDAKEKGNVVNSREVSSFFIFFGSFLLAIYLWEYGSGILQNLSSIFESISLQSKDLNMAKMFTDSLILILQILAIPMIIFIILVIFSSLLQHGPILSFEGIKPSLSKVSLIAGLKRVFSLKSIVEFLKGIVKIVIAGILGYLVFSYNLSYMSNIYLYEMDDILKRSYNIGLEFIIHMTIFVFFIAIIDFLYQKYEYIKSLKMTKQEIKEEFKEREGNPEVKAKIQSTRREIAMSRMAQTIPNADVLIMNPEHYAVALEYDENSGRAPKITAKGRDFVALRMRDIAEEHKVIVYRNPPLARSLYDNFEIDDNISPEYYQAVAEVIAFVYRSRSK